MIFMNPHSFPWDTWMIIPLVVLHKLVKRGKAMLTRYALISYKWGEITHLFPAVYKGTMSLHLQLDSGPTCRDTNGLGESCNPLRHKRTNAPAKLPLGPKKEGLHIF